MSWINIGGISKWIGDKFDEPPAAELPKVQMTAWHRGERDARIRSLARAGYDVTEVAERVDVSEDTVERVLRAAPKPTRRFKRLPHEAPPTRALALA